MFDLLALDRGGIMGGEWRVRNATLRERSNMTTPSKVEPTHLYWVIAVDLESPRRLRYQGWQDLPGTPTYSRRYHACLDDPEELAMFADDVRHDIRSSHQLALLGLEDLTQFHPSLF
jgi:hypothetical protein